jgi:hypothetical protein
MGRVGLAGGQIPTAVGLLAARIVDRRLDNPIVNLRQFGSVSAAVISEHDVRVGEGVAIYIRGVGRPTVNELPIRPIVNVDATEGEEGLIGAVTFVKAIGVWSI